MSQLNLNLPVIGQTNATEDPKVRTALSDIQTVVNALDNTNIASAADINGSKLLDGSVTASKASTAAPSSNLTASTTNSTGTATSLARSDHSHAITTGAAGTITGTNAEGTSASLARADHNHKIQAVGAFSAYFSGSRSLISTGAYLDFDAEDYDVNNWHDSTGTKGEYKPQKAGYYRLGVYWDAQALTTSSIYDVILRKNTVDTGRFLILEQAGHPSYPFGRAEIVVYANGSTDAFRVFAYHTSTSDRTLTTGSGVYACRFYGHYIGSD